MSTRTWATGADRWPILSGITGSPVLQGNAIELLRDSAILPAMLDEISRAERGIDLMSYVWWAGPIADRFAERLADRAQAGVRVRVLLDSIGSRRMPRRHIEAMRNAGVQLEFFRPRWSWKVWQLNLRTHRRVLVVDDEVAFTGGVGIAQEWAGTEEAPAWRETHLRVRGPAVDGIHSGFYSDWVETPYPPVDEIDRWPERETVGDVDAQVLLASSQSGWNSMALALRALIGTAQERIRITTAYFRPPRHFRRLLSEATEAGVEVDVLVPGGVHHPEPFLARDAGRHHYAELVELGVRIHEYQPTMMHAKVFSVDGEVGMVGTTNFDARSLALNEQIAVILHDARLVAELDEHFEADLADSRTVDPDGWSRRGLAVRAWHWLGHAATFPIRGAAATKRGRILGAPHPPN